MLAYVRAWSVFAVSLLAMLLVPRLVHAQCVDESLKEELIGGRHYRGVQDRLFTKALRIIPIARLSVSLSAGEGIRPRVPWVSSLSGAEGSACSWSET